MDVRARVNYRIIALALVFIGVFCGLIIFAVWWQNNSLPYGPPARSEDLKVLGYTWGADNASITLSVRNVGIMSLAVSDVLVNRTTMVNAVVYGENFTETTHTLLPGTYSTITITYAFKSGVSYELIIVSANLNNFPYTVTAPTFSSTPPAQTPQIVSRPPYELRISHAWNVNNANITSTMRNTGNKTLEVSTVRVNGNVVNAVIYGISFNGTTTHTLEVGLYGSITITYQFSSGLNYEFEVVSADGYNFPYTATAP